MLDIIDFHRFSYNLIGWITLQKCRCIYFSAEPFHSLYVCIFIGRVHYENIFLSCKQNKLTEYFLQENTISVLVLQK